MRRDLACIAWQRLGNVSQISLQHCAATRQYCKWLEVVPLETSLRHTHGESLLYYTSCIGHLAPKKRAVLLITGAAEVGCRRSSWLGWPVGILIAGLLALRSWQTPAQDQDAVLAMLTVTQPLNYLNQLNARKLEPVSLPWLA